MKVEKHRILLYSWLPTGTYLKNLAIWHCFPLKSGEFGPIFPWKNLCVYRSKSYFSGWNLTKSHQNKKTLILCIQIEFSVNWGDSIYWFVVSSLKVQFLLLCAVFIMLRSLTGDFLGWPILATLWNIFWKKCVFIFKMKTKVIVLAKLLIMMVLSASTLSMHW
jgi:hypothetical protein